jgi:phage terminase large subunit GpA-like protein
MSAQVHPVLLGSEVIGTFCEGALVLKPPPMFTVTEWAEEHRLISTESSAFPGKYRASLAPYQRGMQDSVKIPGVEKVTFFTSGQVGKSISLENIFCYFCAEDPCPIIIMWPTELVAKQWHDDTLDPMLRDNPMIGNLIDTGSRKSSNKALFKQFPGGNLSLIGANSAAGLRRRRARLVFCEEVDSYPVSAGKEGDPRSLVAKRQETFWNAVMLQASTCTIKGMSPIEASFLDSNMQYYWVPCVHCNEYQTLGPGKWARVTWPKGEEPTVENVSYACEHCGAALYERDKPEMLRRGEWRALHPERVKHQGFWLNTLYSPLTTWAKLVADFIEAKEHPENPELLKAFMNMTLAETWDDERGTPRVVEDELMKRREHYPRTPGGTMVLPDGVTVLTAGVDMQDDRIELVVKGYGKGRRELAGGPRAHRRRHREGGDLDQSWTSSC